MNRGPLILAIVLLLLPVLYVGSYFALVNPSAELANLAIDSREPEARYRIGGRAAEVAFFPLEQIDRKVRPSVWQPFYLEDDKPW